MHRTTLGTIRAAQRCTLLARSSRRATKPKCAAQQFCSRSHKDLAIPELAVLETFANLDHDRMSRTGFPEAVFAEGKTSKQVASILEAMARRANEAAKDHPRDERHPAILATRVTSDMYDELSTFSFREGEISYHPQARIIRMEAHSATAKAQQQQPSPGAAKAPLVVVATAGTTDLPVAEEAAVTLEAAGCQVDRIYDVGVAGLHRIIRALPRLRHPDVGGIIVCAGMDGALPSVVGGLVTVPVVAVPTSVGYGASFSGVSALLTMLNSCSPGVGVVNIDNGFGAAALAFKIIASGASRRPSNSLEEDS